MTYHTTYHHSLAEGGLNALHLATIGNHVEVVTALVGIFGLSVTQRDNVNCALMHVLTVYGGVSSNA